MTPPSGSDACPYAEMQSDWHIINLGSNILHAKRIRDAVMVVGTVPLGRTFISVPSGDWDGSRPFFILQVKPGTVTGLSLVPKVDTGIG